MIFTFTTWVIPWHNCFIISEEQRTRLSNHLFPLKYTASLLHTPRPSHTSAHTCNFPEHTLSGGSNIPFDDGLMNEKHFEVPLHETMMFDKLFPPRLWVPMNTQQRHKTIKITIPSLTDDAVYKLHFILSQTEQCNPSPYHWTKLSALYQPSYAIAATASREKRLSTRCTFRGAHCLSARKPFNLQ